MYGARPAVRAPRGLPRDDAGRRRTARVVRGSRVRDERWESGALAAPCERHPRAPTAHREEAGQDARRGDHQPHPDRRGHVAVEQARDRGEKFAANKQISSLQEYVLVSQDERRVEVRRRGDRGWSTEVATAGATIEIHDNPVLVDSLYG